MTPRQRTAEALAEAAHERYESVRTLVARLPRPDLIRLDHVLGEVEAIIMEELLQRETPPMVHNTSESRSQA